MHDIDHVIYMVDVFGAVVGLLMALFGTYIGWLKPVTEDMESVRIDLGYLWFSAGLVIMGFNMESVGASGMDEAAFRGVAYAILFGMTIIIAHRTLLYLD